ncbi:isoaspartyl peptidase/L-asparaginase, partial [Xanthomonas perforans]
EVIRNVGSFAVVEMMRQGKAPADACREVVMRLVRRKPELTRTLQVGFLAMNKRGEVGAFAIQKGFSYAVCDAQRQDLLVPGQSHYTSEPAA